MKSNIPLHIKITDYELTIQKQGPSYCSMKILYTDKSKNKQTTEQAVISKGIKNKRYNYATDKPSRYFWLTHLIKGKE